jgi:hypothetical protein
MDIKNPTSLCQNALEEARENILACALHEKVMSRKN